MEQNKENCVATVKRLFNNGDSVVIVLPAKMLSRAGWGRGTEVIVRQSLDQPERFVIEKI